MLQKNPTIGLALGAGGARGLAHIGVLETFEKENINVDYIAGSSIGSMIGGIYSCNIPINYIKGLAYEINWEYLRDLTFPRQGMIKGEKLLNFLEIITKNRNIEDLSIPFSAVACDIEQGEEIIFSEGNLPSSIRASTSIPGIFVPYSYQGHLLVDGAVLNRVPINIVKEMGADIVIGVDVGRREINNEVNNIFDILLNTFDIMQKEFQNIKKHNSDIIIEPAVTDISAFNLNKADYCINSGIEATKKIIPELRRLIKERSG